jgi:hypothetical protein
MHTPIEIRLLLFSLLMISITGSCRRESFSPSQADSFVKFFGVHHKGEGFDVKTLSDGGYILAGTTTSENSGTNIVLIRTDRFGNEVWQPKQFGGQYDDRANSLLVLPDGGYAILGSTTVEAGSQVFVSNMYLVRTDNQGNELWTRDYGGLSNDIGYNLTQTSDGGFILIGSTENLHTGDTYILQVKIDSEGKTEWTRVHGVSPSVGTYITETDDGYLFTGYTISAFQPGQSNLNIFIIRTNKLGRITFPFIYGSTGNDYGTSLVRHIEGGYVILGTTTNPANGVKNVFLAQVEENISNLVWSNTYGGEVNHEASCIKMTNEGNFVITGTKEVSPNNHDIFLLKTDGNGNEIFFKTFGGTGHQRGAAIDITADGGFVITGSNETGGNSMITLIKTTPSGDL